MSAIIQGQINGIDVSSVQKNLDANAIRDAGFEFAYVKASQYSSTPDLQFDTLVDRLRAAGLRVGAYHFCSHSTDPVTQAEFFYRASGGLGSEPSELPPMIDWEFCTPQNYPDHPGHCVDWLVKFAKRCKEKWYGHSDRLPIIYSYPSYCSNHQPALETSALNEYPLCFASYGPGPGIPPMSKIPFHKLPLPWTDWVLCQYSGNNGVDVPGVGVCDRQVFNGDRAAWDAFCGITNQAQPVIHPEVPL